MIIELFKEFSPELAALEGKIDESSITDILFAQRFDTFSTHIGVNSVKAAEAILGKTLPRKLKGKLGCRYGFDLDTLKTNQIRIYYDVKEDPKVMLKGFIVDQDLNIIEKKIYKKDGKERLLVDKFDGNGKITVKDDPERVSSLEEWKGPKEIYDIAIENSLNVIFLKKENRDQTYLRIDMTAPRL